MKDSLGVGIGVLVLFIGLVIGVSVILAKVDGNKTHNEFQDYDYITVEGETFETADIVDVEGGGGYDKYYTITLKDGTKIVVEGYILRNKK